MSPNGSQRREETRRPHCSVNCWWLPHHPQRGPVAEGASGIPVKTLLLTAVQKCRAHRGASLALPRLHCPRAATLPTNSAPGTHMLIFQACGAKTHHHQQGCIAATGPSPGVSVRRPGWQHWRRLEEICALQVLHPSLEQPARGWTHAAPWQATFSTA